MKTLVRMLMCMACVALLSSCEKDPEFSGLVNLDELKNFDANFTVYDFRDYNDPDYLDPSTAGGCLKTWIGSGNSTTFGSFSVEITLLCDFENLSFCNFTGTFKAVDGSELIFSIAEGKYECIEDTLYETFQFSFNDLAIIDGGTGRFEGATGSFYPNALIHNGEPESWYAKFMCKGGIELNSGN